MGGLFRTASSASDLFPLIGVAAFLGAGYRVPLAAVVFVAEATRRPGFIVPGLIAAMVAQLFMGARLGLAISGHGARRAPGAPLPAATDRRAEYRCRHGSSWTALSEFFSHHFAGDRENAVAVVDGSHYLESAGSTNYKAVPHDRWSIGHVGDHMRNHRQQTDVAFCHKGSRIANQDPEPRQREICKGDAFVGVVTTAEILKLAEILDQTGGVP